MRTRVSHLDENAEEKEMDKGDVCSQGNSETLGKLGAVMESEGTGTEAASREIRAEAQRDYFIHSSDAIIQLNVGNIHSGDDRPRISDASASDNVNILQAFEANHTAVKHREDVRKGSIEGSRVSESVTLLSSGKSVTHDNGSSVVPRVRIGNDGMHGQMIRNSDHDTKEGTDSEEEEDDDDIDFNPFLVNSPSPEGSSGLSSESEDLEDEHDAGGVKNDANSEGFKFIEQHEMSAVDCASKGLGMEEEDDENVSYDLVYKSADLACNIQDPSNAENYFDGNRNITQDGCNLQIGFDEGAVSPSSSFEEDDADTDHKYSLEQNSRDFETFSNFSNSFGNEDLDMENALKENIKGEEQAVDAICRRTRAHYSLADMSLDELEAFLQESDEEDYFQNVDDEEEYRKFVAAVQSGLAEGTEFDNLYSGRQGEEEEDEEDDYDFEVELEEALESDYEEKCEEVRKCTRQSVGHKKKNESKRLLSSAKVPLRPLLPSGVLNDPATDTNKFFHECSNNGKPRTYGFTACQRGQLYCLLHEHVQLLVQIFSLTVLDFSRQQIAVDTHKLLVQLTETREQVLSWKKPPFSEVCSCPFSVHCSIAPNSQPPSSSNPHYSCTSDPDNAGSDESGYKSVKNARSQSPIQSLLDVPSLAIVKEFLADVDRVAESFKQKRIQSASDGKMFVRTPLFPKPVVQENKASSRESQRVKMSMAANLVEDTKSNGVALVPQEISMAISRFISLFNPDLFPHKPPPAALAKRLLFSDAEDELLAMGIMTYNTNWEMIQQHFLPSKTTHQIFVRQKNRSTSRAPENSIKAVRRLKSSPLTKEEQACIEEGLRIFKNDWTKVWEQCVPYRDPTTLSRLWRAALGIRKSYSTSESRAKHKPDENVQRKKKTSIANHEGDTGEVNNGDETCEESASVYLHEAFLTEWNPNEICFPASTAQGSAVSSSLPVTQMSSGTPIMFSSSRTVSQQARGLCRDNASNPSVTANHFVLEGRHVPTIPTTRVGTRVSKRNRKRRYCLFSSQSFQNGAQMVKLAPGLPSVNLPPCVRVIRQDKLNNHVVTGNGGGPKIHKITVVSSTNVPGLDPMRSGMQVFQPETAPERIASRTDYLPMTFASSSEIGASTSGDAAAKIHPLLMQTTLESGTTSRKGIVHKSTAQTLPLGAPQFRPFINGSTSKGKSVLLPRTAISTADENGIAELHPFLQEDIDNRYQLLSSIRDTVHQTVKDTVHQTIRDTVHQIGSMVHYHNSVSLVHPEWPSVLSDSVIRPEPRRAAQVSGAAKHQGKGSGIASQSGSKLSSTGVGEKSSSLLEQFCEEENIVMEQEELSDSDEDSAEGVQFECEEMGDSESECSDHEKHGSDKGDEEIEFEEEEIGSEDSDA